MKNLDIIEFYKTINFEIFSREVLYISFLLAILLCIIILIISKYSKYFAIVAEREIYLSKVKNKYLTAISNLSIEDENYFYKINFNIKSFLEELELMPWITKMTKKEIFKKKSKISELKHIIEQCEKYEFSSEKEATNQLKQFLKEQSLLIIKSN